MTTIEHLLQKLQEECNEVGKEASKCNLFGVDDKNAVEIKSDPNWPTNRELLAQEIDDLIGVIEMLQSRGIIRGFNRVDRASWKLLLRPSRIPLSSPRSQGRNKPQAVGNGNVFCN